jgi:hypothetical protein
MAVNLVAYSVVMMAGVTVGEMAAMLADEWERRTAAARAGL